MYISPASLRVSKPQPITTNSCQPRAPELTCLPSSTFEKESKYQELPSFSRTSAASRRSLEARAHLQTLWAPIYTRLSPTNVPSFSFFLAPQIIHTFVLTDPNSYIPTPAISRPVVQHHHQLLPLLPFSFVRIYTLTLSKFSG